MGIKESVGRGSNEDSVPGWGRVEFGRRLGLKAVAGTALIAGTTIAATSTSEATSNAETIKIGYVTPSTGSFADFAGPDRFVLSLIRSASQFAKGITIQQSAVDLIVTSSGPETVIPVSVVCEDAGVPCLSTACPWETWWSGFVGNSIGPAGNAVGSSPQYCSMFFFGVPELVECFLPMWNKVLRVTDADQVYAGMFPNDADGIAFRSDWPSTMATLVSAEGGTPWTLVAMS